VSAPLRHVAPSRRIHTAITNPAHISERFLGMFSGGPHPSTERINKFMNEVYFHRPTEVTLFNINYRNQAERSTIKGLRVGPNLKGPRKNVVIVSGLPLQDPSTIGVNLYVAAMLSRLSLSCDVSVIPLAHPREYERRWRRPEAPPMLFPSSDPSQILPTGSVSDVSPSFVIDRDPKQCVVTENISLELKDTCKPIEAYITRQNKFYVNIEVDLSTHGSSAQYKSNSLPVITSKGKLRDFFAQSKNPLPDSLPSIYGEDSMLSPFLQAPSLVLELRGSQALDDDQIVARGEDVIRVVKELANEPF